MNNEPDSKRNLTIILAISAILIIGAIIAGLSWYFISKKGKDTASTAEIGQVYPAESWLSYQNSRFGFSLKYPPNFTATESQNGDGVTLASPDNPKMTIRAFASNNALSQDLTQYLNWVRENLNKESSDLKNAEEILAEDATLSSMAAKERQWKHLPSASGILTLIDQITTLKNDIFYNLELEIPFANYDESSAHIFDNIISSYKIN